MNLTAPSPNESLWTCHAHGRPLNGTEGSAKLTLHHMAHPRWPRFLTVRSVAKRDATCLPHASTSNSLDLPGPAYSGVTVSYLGSLLILYC